jgi:hypothetical protein
MAFSTVIMALPGGKRHDHGSGATANAMITNKSAANGQPG